MKLLLATLILFAIHVASENIVSTCLDLKQMKNDLGEKYALGGDIDCIGVEFESIGFEGSGGFFFGELDGRGFQISNLMVTSGGQCTGLFACGVNAVISNLILTDFQVSSNELDYVGSLFGKCLSCTISNCTLGSRQFGNSNLVYGANFVGGLVGSGNGTIKNCVVQNTFIYALNSNAGGFAGEFSGEISNCSNLGFNYFDEKVVESSYASVGGIVGKCNACTISKSGILSGKIVSLFYGNAGGIAGSVTAGKQGSYFSELYVKPQVSVESQNGTSGGLFGGLQSPGMTTANVSDCYVKASLSSLFTVGGIVGEMNLSSPYSQVTFTNCFSSAHISAPPTIQTRAGSVVGSIRTEFSYFNESLLISFDNVYFDTLASEYTGIGFKKRNVRSSPQPLTCPSLYQRVLSTFNRNVWGGEALKSEYKYSFGFSSCQVADHDVQIVLNTKITSLNSPTTSSSSPQVPLATSTAFISATIPPSQKQHGINLYPTTLPTHSTVPCALPVPNCEKCNLNPPKMVNETDEISCELINGLWEWVLSKNSSLEMGGNSSFHLNSTTNVSGDVNQSANATLVVNVSGNSSPTLNVNGCANMRGHIRLILHNRPSQTEFLITIINHNCSFNSNTSSSNSSQIIIQPNYKGSQCDHFSPKIVSKPHSVSVSLTSSLGVKCGENSVPLVVGLVVGICVGTVIIISLIISLVKRRYHRLAVTYVNEIQMRKMGLAV